VAAADCILTREAEEAQARFTPALIAIACFSLDPKFPEPLEEERSTLLVLNVSPGGPLLAAFVPPPDVLPDRLETSL
jgi:hypothetical protein